MSGRVHFTTALHKVMPTSGKEESASEGLLPRVSNRPTVFPCTITPVAHFSVVVLFRLKVLPRSHVGFEEVEEIADPTPSLIALR